MNRKTAVVVDDATDSAMLLARLLKMVGYEARVAYDAFSAIALVEESVPQLIFLDIGLPEMDGTELARRIRLLPGADAATLIAVSGFAPPADQAGVRALGFDHYVTKPINIPAIRAMIESFAARIEAASPASSADAGSAEARS